MKLIASLSLALPLLAGMSSAAYADQHWPDLPEGVKSGVSAQVGNKLYVGLGSMENRFYMLDLDNVDKGWQKQADFAGPARSGATASVLGDSIYVFGGSGKNNADDKSPILFDTVFRYDVNANKWQQVDTETPVGLLGASSFSPDNQQILFFGGYNKGFFDKYLSDINMTDKKTNPTGWQEIVDNYMGMKPLDYKWNRQVLSFNPKTGTWTDLGQSPYLPNCGTALVADGASATLVSGEIKPGLRTAEVKEYSFGSDQPWSSSYDLPAPTKGGVQEGVAGAFAGKSNGALIVAGGANFHGAKAAFESGNMFAHEGLPKAFNPEVYVQKNELWARVSDLPEGLAYGASFTTDDGVVIAGGEKADRSASNKVYLLEWNGSDIEITD